MKLLVKAAAIGGLLACAPNEPPMGGGAALATEETIWDGVYSLAQAERGSTVYARACASCHGNSGDGSPFAPGIIGSSLDRRWIGQPIGSYFALIRGSMPPGRPGSLREDEYLAVLAHLLRLHGAPSGEGDLPGGDALNQIRIVARPAG